MQNQINSSALPLGTILMPQLMTIKDVMAVTSGVCQHSCHPYLNQATKTSVGITRLDRRTGLSAVG